MPAKRIRIEIFDNEGNKYSISFEGRVTREKTLRILDLVELLGGLPSDLSHNIDGTFNSVSESGPSSKYEKVAFIIRKYFPIAWFTSKDVQEAFENEFKEPISLSTISTYLSRMVDRGLLIKSGSSNKLKYRISRGSQNVELKTSTLSP
ncbi:MAG: hypothetical protein QXR17_05695 [Candidatus Bathyarchaeia archaeon]